MLKDFTELIHYKNDSLSFGLFLLDERTYVFKHLFFLTVELPGKSSL